MNVVPAWLTPRRAAIAAAAALGIVYLAAVAGPLRVGLAGLVFSTALSYTGDRFPEWYAGGRLAATYRVAWGLERDGDAEAVDEQVLWALRRYDPDPPGLP